MLDNGNYLEFLKLDGNKWLSRPLRLTPCCAASILTIVVGFHSFREAGGSIQRRVCNEYSILPSYEHEECNRYKFSYEERSVAVSALRLNQ